MKRIIIAAALSLAAGQAQASCEDAWYLRNLAFDRGGYCFGSTLGKSIFDNGDCSTKSPALSAWDRRMIDATKRYEAEMGCAIDTGATSLETSLIGKLDDVDELPTIAPYESLCLGFNGPDLPVVGSISGGLRAAYPTGEVVAGDTVRFRFESADGFEFVTTDLSAGWIAGGAITAADCRDFAG